MTDDENHHGGEILIKTDYGIGDRKTLKTLMPKGWVDQEVLNLLACRLTHIENLLATHATTWFLPTMFAQYALDWVHTPEIVRGYYQHNFMGKVDYVRKIFIPINDQNVHWYLLIVDFHERKLLLLDSSPSPERKDCRRRHIKRVALFLEDMLTDKSFYDQPLQYKHVISEFALVEPIGLHRQRFGL